MSVMGLQMCAAQIIDQCKDSDLESHHAWNVSKSSNRLRFINNPQLLEGDRNLQTVGYSNRR